MRSFQVFATMTDEEAEAFFGAIKKAAPAYYKQSIHAASVVHKMRPAFLAKQPFAKQVKSARRALARVATNSLADETLAVYFLEVRKELLLEWLDGVGVEHEDGALQQDTPESPPEDGLRKSIDEFRAADDDADRELLLRAFSAQSSIDWPVLDALIAEKLSA